MKFSTKFFKHYTKVNILNSCPNPEVDLALLHIFMEYKKVITEVMDGIESYYGEVTLCDFHKTFRQTDVLPKVYTRTLRDYKPSDICLDVVVHHNTQRNPSSKYISEK